MPSYRLIFVVLICGAIFICTSKLAQTQQLATNLTPDNTVGDAYKNAPIERQPATSSGKRGATAKAEDEKSKTEAILLSDMETNKQIESPATLLWLLQTQQNNAMMAMPANMGKGNYFRHTIEFEPLLPNELSKNWTLGFRPVLPIAVSQPYPQVTGVGVDSRGNPALQSTMHRMTSFGDMALGMGVNPNPALIHNWLINVGATFIFPTATHKELGQKNWQAGPITNIGKIGHHYLTYVMQQTWWKIGGDGQRTRQTWARYMYNYNWENGWMLGTMNDILIDWQAHRDQRLAFPIGPQIGKLVHAGLLPVQIAVSANYYAVRPSNLHADLMHQTVIPKWNFQLMMTPIIPTMQEILRHQIPQDPTRKRM